MNIWMLKDSKECSSMVSNNYYLWMAWMCTISMADNDYLDVTAQLWMARKVM